MMSKRVNYGNFPANATEDQFRRLRVTHGGVASLSVVEPESPVRYRGLEVADVSALVELEPVVSEPQWAMKQAKSAWRVWMNGTLPGVMARRRPALATTGAIRGALPGRRGA